MSASMGPRKKSRRNSQAPTDLNQSLPDAQKRATQGETAQTSDPADVSVSPTTTASVSGSPPNETVSKGSGRSSWYGGSWKLKSSPLTQTARESISVAQGVTSEALAESGKQIVEASKRPGQYMSRGMRGSRKSIPVLAETTKTHATSDANDKSRSRLVSQEKLKGLDGVEDAKDRMAAPIAPEERTPAVEEAVEGAPLPPEPTESVVAEDSKSIAGKSIASSQRPQSGLWWGWWSRPDGYDSDLLKSDANDKQLDEATSTPLPRTPNNETEIPDPVSKSEPADASETAPQASPGLQPEMNVKTGSARSWFGLWSSAQNEQAAIDEQAIKDPQQRPPPEVTVSADGTPESMLDDTLVSRSDDKPNGKPDDADHDAPSGWAFWSTDKTRTQAATPGGTQKQIGELAVADTPSQSHPEAAQFNEQRDGAKAKPKRNGSLLRRKRANLDKPEQSGESPATTPVSTPRSSTPVGGMPVKESLPVKEDNEIKPVQRGKVPIQTRPNLILPEFVTTYPTVRHPSYLEKASQYVAETLRIIDPKPSPRHIFKTTVKPRIKKAIALGVHGHYPPSMLRSLLGQPTGTSIRFANYGAAEIKAWCEANQPEIKDTEIEKVALEGEGHVSDRVDTLWKLMLNWLSHLRQADFILVCCHSQGVPVAISLMAKLIQLGCLSPNARIGVCAMAGINLGPFLEYRSRFFGGSALELFDFCDNKSKVSRAYAESLDICLRHGVRITYVGGLDDQLVSLESSLHVPLSHPYVNRAVFVDGRLHAPNFLTHLVIFALKLRNRGLSDHGLIRELSAPLAGSLVGGEGHSRVYDDPAVYRLAIDFALESTAAVPSSHPATSEATGRPRAFDRRSSTTSYPTSTAAANSMRRGTMSESQTLPGIGAIIAPYEPPPNASNANPFYLPWAVRGMLEEELVKREMMDEVRQLVVEFDEWKPTSKVLKDVKWRLEAVKGMV
ncbi:hypothetical protein Q7P36_001894 [Cladosporium allicinum]